MWEATPILRNGDAYLIAGAAELLIALRHHLILVADRNGWRDALVERLASAYASTVDRALERLGWSATQLSARGELPAHHAVWAFDADALALVMDPCRRPHRL